MKYKIILPCIRTTVRLIHFYSLPGTKIDGGCKMMHNKERQYSSHLPGACSLGGSSEKGVFLLNSQDKKEEVW